nr:hypothetical protein [Halomicrobium sp. LC1Hm]
MVVLAGFVLLVIVQREIAILEPDYFEASASNTIRIEPLVVHAHEVVGRKRWLIVDPTETVTGCKSGLDNVESIKIDRRTAG